MKHFDLQGIEINASPSAVLAFIRDPANLPRWTHAFAAADAGAAQLRTDAGAVTVGLQTRADASTGVVDWHLTFPDGTVGTAHSRVVETARGTSIYSFVLHAPPVALELLEGALAAQSETLRTELLTLKALLES
jgi:hypothetical protein